MRRFSHRLRCGILEVEFFRCFEEKEKILIQTEAEKVKTETLTEWPCRLLWKKQEAVIETETEKIKSNTQVGITWVHLYFENLISVVYF